MDNSNDILNELREISPLLANLEKRNLFTVPKGYFEGVADNLLHLVKYEESNFLAGVKKQKISSVPEGYFDSLAETILNKIKTQETTGDYPVLAKISKQNVYTVPEGYFDSISNEVNEKLRQPVAIVASIKKRTGWFKYAAAAVFTGIISLGVYKYMNTDTITAYTPDATTAAGIQIAKENKFDEELSKVTDDDIIKYLQKNNTDVDAALVANVVDENELPSKEDYLTDDKALDKYLDNIDLTDLKN